MKESNSNQPPAFIGGNLFAQDPMLIATLGRACDQEFEIRMTTCGAIWGSAESLYLARKANAIPPILNSHDPSGRRIDQVEYHPSYHALLRRTVDAGLHFAALDPFPRDRRYVHRFRAAQFYLTAQCEIGHLCPISMTNAACHTLSAYPAGFEAFAKMICSRQYDSTSRPYFEKHGILLGMGLTERQAGSDLKNIGTVAEITADGYRLTGHKWFFSAPMSDAHLALALDGGQPTAFLIPRFQPDGTQNHVHITRLKDKMGNRANATAEVEMERAFAWRIGSPGEGIQTLLSAVTPTRIDCAIGSAALIRAALAQAVHHVRHRLAFGKKLVDLPLMLRVLGDMSLDMAAALALSMRLAVALDEASGKSSQAAYLRIMTPVTKYWVCKIAPALIYEAMECLGGNGYCETFDLARLYREAPVNAIWEGAGNIMALDLLRAITNDRQQLDTVLEEFRKALGPQLEAGHRQLTDLVASAADACLYDQGSARILTEQLAIMAAAAALRESAPPYIADAFIQSRFSGGWRSSYGMIDGRVDLANAINWMFPDE